MSTARKAAAGSTMVLLDADGNITTDRAKAVTGEIVSTDSEGHTTSTLFDTVGGGGAGEPQSVTISAP